MLNFFCRKTSCFECKNSLCCFEFGTGFDKCSNEFQRCDHIQTPQDFRNRRQSHSQMKDATMNEIKALYLYFSDMICTECGLPLDEDISCRILGGKLSNISFQLVCPLAISVFFSFIKYYVN